MSQRQVFHVVPQDQGKWRVEPEGRREVGRVFEDKEEAVRQATENAKAADTGQIIVHGRDGRIQYEHTYGEDPRERKG
ncbi:MAG TPA: DUF2188 domain-containing protein [Gemmatimonadales bacterium]|jgi:Uncharacterized protein conserved in bacteria (DUF2188)